MSVKRSKPLLPRSAYQIAQARKLLKTMPRAKKLELMLEARLITPEQFETGQRKLAELAAEGKTPADFFAENAAKREREG